MYDVYMLISLSVVEVVYPVFLADSLGISPLQGGFEMDWAHRIQSRPIVQMRDVGKSLQNSSSSKTGTVMHPANRNHLGG